MPRQLDTTDPLARETAAERVRLADLYAALRPDQWAAPSLCAGWRVREVVAHVTMPYRHSGFRVLRGIAAARGDFNRFADTIAHSDTARHSDAELLAALRDNVAHPWRPPGGGQAGALSHDVIHGLDVTESLGLPRPPADRVRHVLGSATPRMLAYFGSDLAGTRLVATDTDLALGDGPEIVELPAVDLLLRVTGRATVTR
ncbi:maleylpyruvate isomerase family mycothiol-dependent enzyme [Actinomycetospora endophytica]|uniref:Maleylpyruvate isomerase family mycothiol-dependent enzyme n=1 Tax=Actinomycetospora endophytica TaxID=2291215 RepID=A0ABS8P4J4_9PSEU|nr:maleylpyruvate isomerase family mycothiol-dependent enzyme [Actinomycetospora endophytica]MCD2192862.1 maleylpyruvate isomerase family mycothiol-dependent enzyme [Actinomycetospora endophytica]